MSQMNMIVKVTIKEECVDQWVAAAKKAQAASQEEAGVVNYELFQDRKVPTTAFFYETYADKDGFKAHATSEHMATFMAETKELVANVEMFGVNPL